MGYIEDDREVINEALSRLYYGESREMADLAFAYDYGAMRRSLLWRKAPWRLDHFWWAYWWKGQTLFYATELLDLHLIYIKEGRNLAADEINVLCTILRQWCGNKYNNQLRRILNHFVDQSDVSAEPYPLACILLHCVGMGVRSLDEVTELRINELADATQLLARKAKESDERNELYAQAAVIYIRLSGLAPVRQTEYLKKFADMIKAANMTEQALEALAMLRR